MSRRGGYMDEETSGEMKKSILLYGLPKKRRGRHSERSEESLWPHAESKRDFSARSVPRNDKRLSFSSNCMAVRCKSSDGSGFVTNNFVTFDDCGHSNTSRPILRFLFHADHLTHRSNKHFRASCDFRGERKGDIKLSAGIQVLLDRKIYATGGDVPCLSVARGLFLDRYPNDDRQRKIISACCSSLSHRSLDPRSRLKHTPRTHPLRLVTCNQHSKAESIGLTNSVFNRTSFFSITGKTVRIGFPPNFHHSN